MIPLWQILAVSSLTFFIATFVVVGNLKAIDEIYQNDSDGLWKLLLGKVWLNTIKKSTLLCCILVTFTTLAFGAAPTHYIVLFSLPAGVLIGLFLGLFCGSAAAFGGVFNKSLAKVLCSLAPYWLIGMTVLDVTGFSGG